MLESELANIRYAIVPSWFFTLLSRPFTVFLIVFLSVVACVVSVAPEDLCKHSRVFA
jgi:hypothetical protein